MDQAAFLAYLDRLGVKAWDTAPPEQGRIQFLGASGSVVGWGRYRVILSYGPDDVYTMAWDIGSYRASGIPFVGRAEAGQPAVVHGASREEAWERGQKVAVAIGSQAIYWASTLLLSIDDFAEGDAGVVRVPGEAERLAEIARARLADGEIPIELDPAQKRPVHRALVATGCLREEMVTAMVFVLEGELNEIAASQSDVTDADIPGLIVAYWKLPAWRPRADLLYLFLGRRDPELVPIWLDILARPTNRPKTRSIRPSQSPSPAWTTIRTGSTTTGTTGLSPSARRGAASRRAADRIQLCPLRHRPYSRRRFAPRRRYRVGCHRRSHRRRSSTPAVGSGSR